MEQARRRSRGDWGRALGLASCPLSVLLSTWCFRDAIAATALIVTVLGLSTAWLTLELYVGVVRSVETPVANPRWVKMTRGLWLLGPWVAWASYAGRWDTLWSDGSVALAMQIVAVVSGAFGLGLRLVAVAQLGRFFTYGIETKSGMPLMTAGVYRYVRHPSFTGLLLLTNFLGLMTGSVVGMLLLASTIPNVLYRIRQEEAELEKRFGAGYLGYRGRTARLVPFVF